MLGLAYLIKPDGPCKQIYYLETNWAILHKEDTGYLKCFMEWACSNLGIDNYSPLGGKIDFLK